MEAEKKIELIKEAMKDYSDGKLPELSLLYVIDFIISDDVVSDAAVEWARKSILKNYKDK